MINFQIYRSGNLINHNNESFKYYNNKTLFVFHGLFGRGKNWHTFAKSLTNNEDIIVITVDLRNHGGNDFKENHSYSLMMNDIIELFNFLNIEKTNILGHSMGGKLAMLLTLNNPNYVNKLIVADIAPVDYPVEKQNIVDYLLNIDLGSILNRNQADEILSKNLLEKFVRNFLLQNLELIEGKYKWSINLRVIKEAMDNLRSFPFTKPKSAVNKELLCIYGQNSNYVTQNNKCVFNDFFLNCSFVEIKNTGHYLHVEQPEEFYKSLRNFLIN